ncbi:MAG: S41 family peptidase [Bdellovibrionales bacterium]
MRRLLIFALFPIGFGVGFFVSQAGTYREVYRYVCDLAAENFYKEDPRLRRWVQECRLRAARLPLRVGREDLLADLQDHMNALEVSHFQVYSPNEDRKLWKGEAVDTGIRARYVEEFLVVYRVLPGSAAERSGIRPGDEIVALPGTEQVTPWGAQHRAGLFQIHRGTRSMEISIEPTPLAIDSLPRLEPLASDTARLEISSFRAEYFPANTWKDMAHRLSQYAHIVIDLRENAGGNFVAMLRALSTFHCADTSVGTLVQPRKPGLEVQAFEDDISDARQLDELAHFRSLELRTFPGYGCYSGRVTVLIGPDTSSVAEIFAHSFFSRPHSRVWGHPTAGDVILAVWYNLPGLGPGYSVSIPEAVYLTPSNQELEGQGVYPQRELHYDLELALKGVDSWLVEAQRAL